MTLGLAALSLFLLLGGYRNSISYGSLEDLGPLVDSQANAEIRLAVESRSTIPDRAPPESQDLLLALRSFFNPSDSERATGQTSLALIDRNGRVIPGYSASPADYSLENAIVKDVAAPSGSPTDARKALHCQVDVPGKPPLLCVRMALSQKVLDAFPGTEAAAIIVAKAPDNPAYQLAVVADDIAMNVTEVVRGDDLIPSTARQNHIYAALKSTPPRYGHVPLVVGPDGKRLAKRHGDARVATFRERGVRPERIIGILARWSGLKVTGDAAARDLLPHWSWKNVSTDRVVLTVEKLAEFE